MWHFKWLQAPVQTQETKDNKEQQRSQQSFLLSIGDWGGPFLQD